MKTKLTIVTLLLSSIALLSFTFPKLNAPANDYNACITKSKSEWGAVCADCVIYKNNKRVYDDTYTVYLKNTCSDQLDIKWAVQEVDKTWRCFPSRMISPNSEVKGFACEGTGKYLYWVKKHGDNEVAFPTDEEINEMYKE